MRESYIGVGNSGHVRMDLQIFIEAISEIYSSHTRVVTPNSKRLTFGHDEILMQQ